MRRWVLIAAIALVASIAWLLFRRQDIASALAPANGPPIRPTVLSAPAPAPNPGSAAPGDDGETELQALIRRMAPQASDRSAGVAGSDADADGVRDDVQLYIRDHWRDPRMRAAMQRYARLQQDFLATFAGGGDASQAMALQLHSLECLQALGGEALLTDSKTVLALTLNTPDRQRAYTQGMQTVAGGLFVSAAGDPCR